MCHFAQSHRWRVCVLGGVCVCVLPLYSEFLWIWYEQFSLCPVYYPPGFSSRHRSLWQEYMVNELKKTDPFKGSYLALFHRWHLLNPLSVILYVLIIRRLGWNNVYSSMYDYPCYQMFRSFILQITLTIMQVSECEDATRDQASAKKWTDVICKSICGALWMY